MGIRFACHHCAHAVHVKDFQAGKRGKCPECGQLFRIPLQNATYSLAIDDERAASIQNTAVASPKAKEGTVRGSSSNVTASQVLAKPKETIQTTGPIAKSNKPATKPSASKPKDAPSSGPPVGIKLKPKAFIEAAGARWYVRPPSGGEYGPASEDLLSVWIEEKRVSGDSLLWREGQPQWLAAEQLLPELYPAGSDFYEEPNRQHSDSDSTVGFPELPVSRPTPPNELTSGAKPSPAALLKAQRKQRQKRNQWLLIGVLSAISMILLAGLIWVLTTSGKAP